MITPSSIDISNYFYGSAFQERHREVIARNIVFLCQVNAFVKDDDVWHPFSLEDYEEFRTQTSQDPVEHRERDMLTTLEGEGYLARTEQGDLIVTSEFLGVVVKYINKDELQASIAAQ